MLATLFNYACHPTTLAWDNRLLSPDYIGAAREVLEQAFGAPALFFHGASGDLAPRDDYVGDASVADRNGRQLGYAAAAAIENLPPPGTQFVYTGIVAVGRQPRRLGVPAVRRRSSGRPASSWRPYEPRRAAAQGGHRRRRERLRRDSRLGSRSGRRRCAASSSSQALGDGPVYTMPLWIWRLGGALLVAVPNEPYSVFQVELRRRLAGTPLLVLGTTNRTMGYLSPRGDLRHRALPGAAVAVRARLPRADDGGRRGGRSRSCVPRVPRARARCPRPVRTRARSRSAPRGGGARRTSPSRPRRGSR